MVRTMKFGQGEDDFEENHDFASTTPDVSPHNGKVEKRSGQKVNPMRSKHSETEQRRRSKINDRFQILRDLIPENDQKRDKASFLLEVIQYIQFLEEKIRAYEATCQGWSPDSSKLMAWQRSVLGTIDNILDQPPELIMRDESVCEENVAAVSSKLLTSSQNSIDSDFTEYRTVDHGIIRQQLNLFDVHPCQGSFPEPTYDLTADQIRSQHHWLSKTSPEYVDGGGGGGGGGVHDTVNLKPDEKLKPTSGGESDISHHYSQGIIKRLSKALHSCGVDLSHTTISVQLDVRKRIDIGSHTPPFTQDDGSGTTSFSEMVTCVGSMEKYDTVNKKQKTHNNNNYNNNNNNNSGL